MQPRHPVKDLCAVCAFALMLLPLLGTWAVHDPPNRHDIELLERELGVTYRVAHNPTSGDIFLLMDETSPAWGAASRFGMTYAWGVRLAPSSPLNALFHVEEHAGVTRSLERGSNTLWITLSNATPGRLYEVQYTLPDTIQVAAVVSESELETEWHRSGEDVYIYARAASPVEVFASYNKGGYQDYYVIGDDWDDPAQAGDDELTMMMFRDWTEAAYGGTIYIPPGAHTVSVVSFAAYGTVRIYLDEVENGYTFDENTFTGYDATFLLSKGQVLTLDESDRYASGSVGISGQDRFFTAGAPVFMVHGAWPSEFNNGISGVISAELWPQYPVLSQQTSYVTPMGWGPGNIDTQYTYLIVQAFQDGTTIKINDPTTGTNPDAKVTLDRGDVYIYGHYDASTGPLVRPAPGTTISATAPVQAGLFTSGGGRIDTRYYMLTSRNDLGSRYIVPVHSEKNKEGGTDVARLYIYSFADQTIHIQDKNGVIDMALQGGKLNSAYVVPEGSAAYIYNDFPTDANYRFWILGAFDSGAPRDDWGFQPIDADLLNTEYFIPYAPSPLDTQPIWISPVEDTTTVYVDFDNDGAADKTLLLNRLDVAQVTDTYDQDNQGTHIWSDKAFAASYGESARSNPSTPNLDFGYTVLPFISDWKSNFLVVGKTTTPDYHITLGMDATSTVTADAPKVDVFNVSVTDTLPAGWAFVPGSASITFTFGGTNRSGSAADPMVTGSTLTWTNLGTLRVGARLTITYVAGSTLASSYGDNVNTAVVQGTDIAGNVFTSQDTSTVYIQPPPVRTKELYLHRAPGDVTVVDGTRTRNIMNRTSALGSGYQTSLSTPLEIYLHPQLASNLSIFGYVNLSLYLSTTSSGIVEFNLYDVDAVGARIPIARSFTTVSGQGVNGYTLGVNNAYYTVPRLHALLLEVRTSGGGAPTVHFDSPSWPSVLTLNTYTYISVDEATTYRGGSKTQYFYRGDTVTVKARVSDPFGSYDIVDARLSILNPLGGVVVIDDPMALTGTDPNTPSAWKDYIYTHTVRLTDPMGWYTVRITATEGNGVTYTSTLKFYVSYYGVVVEPDTTKYAAPGTSVEHPEYIQNVGQVQDTFSLLFSVSTLGWGSVLIISSTVAARDDDGDGTFEYVDPAWDSNGDSLPDVDLTAGASLPLTVRRYVPASADASDSDTLLLIGRSLTDPNVMDNASLTTVVPAPPERSKELYLHYQANSPDGRLDRVAPTTSSTRSVQVNEQETYYWKLIPQLSGRFRALSAKARVYIDITDAGTHPLTVQIYDSLVMVAERTFTIQASAGWYDLQVPITHTFDVNAQIRLGLYYPDDGDGISDRATVLYDSTGYPSRLEFRTTTYIDVEWVKTYDTSGSERTDFKQGDTVIVRAYVTDPFGDYDISSARLTIVDPRGQVVVNDVPMSIYSSSPRIYGYTYTVPASAYGGTFGMNVTAVEGNGVTDWGVASFDVAMGEMTVQKIGDRAYAVPGDRITYQVWYNNTGSDPAAVVWLNDTLPSGVKFIGSSPPPASISGRDIRWVAYNVAPGPHLVTVEVEVLTVPDATVLSNTVLMVFRDMSGKVHDPQSAVFSTTVRLTIIQASKTVDRSAAYPGETVRYTLYYNNTGSGVASYVWVNDTLPAGASFVGSSIPYDSVSGSTYRWVLRDVAPGTYALSVTARIGPVAPMSVLTNLLRLAHTDVSGNVHTSMDTASTTVLGPVMSFEKVADRGSAYPGEIVTFTIWYNNTGNAPGYLTVNDTLPPGLEYVGSSVPYTSKSGNVYTWEFDAVSVGVHSFTVSALVLATSSGVEVNMAEMDVMDAVSNQYPRLDAVASVNVLVPLVEMGKGAVSSITPYDTLKYTIWYNNTGNANASVLWVNDTLPAGASYIGSSIPYDSVSGDVYTWLFRDVPPGTHLFTLTVRIGNLPDGTELVNNVSGVYFSGPMKYERFAEHRVSVHAPFIQVVKVGDRRVATIGDTVTYTIYYNNTGSDTASVVWLNDTLPPDTVYRGSSLPYASVSGRTYTWVLANVTPGTHSLQVRVEVDVGAQFNVWEVNDVLAVYTDSTGDIVGASNSTFPFRVQAPIILPEKEGAVSPGDPTLITYTIWYNNTGVQMARRVWVNDSLPGYVTFVESVPPPANVSGGVVSWRFDYVPVGAHSLTLTVRVDPGLFNGTVLVNRVYVNYTDLNGNMMLPSSAVHRMPYAYGVERFTFPRGTLLIPMDGMQDADSRGGVYYPGQVLAYGLVYWAVRSGLDVHWVVNTSKGYGSPDLTVLTDDDGDPAVTGDPALRSYGGGPFLITDPDANTSYNEAWDTLGALALSLGLEKVRLHELYADLTLDPWDVYEVHRAPSIAIRTGSAHPGWTNATDQVPYLWNRSYFPGAMMPVTNVSDADVRSGALTRDTGSDCISPAYDILLLGDDEFQDSSSFPTNDPFFESIDEYVSGAGGHILLACTGTTLAVRTSWFVDDARVIEENDIVPGDILAPVSGMAGHPLLQTWGTIRANRGTFMAWDASNAWSTGSRALTAFREPGPGDGTGEIWEFPDGYRAYPDTVNGSQEDDPAYVYAAEGMGVVNSLGGHTAGTDMPKGAMTSTVQPRLILDSVFYSVVTPRPVFDVSPRFAKRGSTANITVRLGLDAGEFIPTGNLSVHLQGNVTFGYSKMLIPWADWTPLDARTGRVSFASYDPRFDPYIAEIGLTVNVSSSSGVQTLLRLTGEVRDTWNVYQVNASGCAYILPTLAPGGDAPSSGDGGAEGDALPYIVPMLAPRRDAPTEASTVELRVGRR